MSGMRTLWIAKLTGLPAGAHEQLMLYLVKETPSAEMIARSSQRFGSLCIIPMPGYK